MWTTGGKATDFEAHFLSEAGRRCVKIPKSQPHPSPGLSEKLTKKKARNGGYPPAGRAYIWTWMGRCFSEASAKHPPVIGS
jgi:hypothetical protein